MRKYSWPLICILLYACHPSPQYDTIIRHGTVYDGTGRPPVQKDVGINADTITFIGDLSAATARQHDIDATGKAVSPGFIDMQSWSVSSLLQDGRSLGAIRQGVTLEVFGEGSWGDRSRIP